MKVAHNRVCQPYSATRELRMERRFGQPTPAMTDLNRGDCKNKLSYDSELAAVSSPIDSFQESMGHHYQPYLMTFVWVCAPCPRKSSRIPSTYRRRICHGHHSLDRHYSMDSHNALAWLPKSCVLWSRSSRGANATDDPLSSTHTISFLDAQERTQKRHFLARNHIEPANVTDRMAEDYQRGEQREASRNAYQLDYKHACFNFNISRYAERRMFA